MSIAAAPSTSPTASQERMRGIAHPFCFVCSPSNPMGLALECRTDKEGRVRSTFVSHAALEGYPGWLHGGLVATLLDGIMTQCVFALGVEGATAELRIRYREPVAVGEPVELEAEVVETRHGCHRLTARLHQNNRLKASASAKFLRRHE